MASASSNASSSSGSSSSGSDSEPDDAVALASSLDALSNSLASLETDFLAPLLATPLKDTLAGLGNELDRAKMQVGLAYTVCDLVWVYLKSKGINPETHPVIGELQRIKSYYGKIQQAENPEQRKFAVDKPAAARFINNALASSQRNVATPTPPTEIGMQTRFNVLKHQEAALRDEEGSEDDSEDSEDSEDENEKAKAASSLKTKRKPTRIDTTVASHLSGSPAPSSSTSKGKKRSATSVARVEVLSPSGEGVPVVDAGVMEKAVGGGNGAGTPLRQGGVGAKSKRTKVDPFAGYDSPSSRGASPAVGAGSPAPSSSTSAGGGGAKGKGKGKGTPTGKGAAGGKEKVGRK